MAHYYRRTGFHVVALVAWGLWPASLSAQVSSDQPPGQLTAVNANVTAVTGVTVRHPGETAPPGYPGRFGNNPGSGPESFPDHTRTA